MYLSMRFGKCRAQRRATWSCHQVAPGGEGVARGVGRGVDAGWMQGGPRVDEEWTQGGRRVDEEWTFTGVDWDLQGNPPPGFGGRVLIRQSDGGDLPNPQLHAQGGGPCLSTSADRHRTKT
jgi:hypothetical protein